MELRLLEYMCSEMDHQLAIAEDGIFEGCYFLDELSQTIQGISEHKTLGFVIVCPAPWYYAAWIISTPSEFRIIKLPVACLP